MRGSLVLLASLAAAQPEERLGEAECRALGFAPGLVCGSCAKLGEFVGQDDALVGECGRCCTAESNESQHFARAVLDVCR